MKDLQNNCKKLLLAYKNGLLGQTKMPEDSNPHFNSTQKQERLAYFSLPMALNYQRDSYKLWEAALKTFKDPETAFVFDVKKVIKYGKDKTRKALLKHKLALQPNKHIDTWIKISKTIADNWGSFENLIKASDDNFINLRVLIQKDYKKGFPYLSGPKIFNYWSFILCEYGKVNLKNREYIEIATDTHITQCSVLLGVITKNEVVRLSKDQISQRWREALEGSGITPIEMHSPLWFWSRNGFLYELDQ